MSLSDVELLFQFIGGLGMFLYGMNVMADGLQKAAGNKLKQMLGFLTNNRILAILVGAGVTAIIQSSSATTVMVVGFVNAGIINLSQAVGVIMGANIGTTVTAWLVSMSEWGSIFKPEFLAPLFVGFGALTMLFVKSERKKDVASIAIGFGVLFIGLNFMSGSITPYKDSPIFSDAFRILGSNPLLGILTGTVVTGIIQSSSASVGILQTLAMNGVVNWNSAIFITLGQNIGTCVTALISSAGANRTAKRAAVIHLLFNVFGAVIFGILFFILFSFNKTWADSMISTTEISIFHTAFNLTNTIILFPFAERLVSLSGKIVKERKELKKEDELLIHLDDRILETPSFAVESAISEVVRMGNITAENLKISTNALLTRNAALFPSVHDTEKKINQMENIMTEYLVKISNLSLTEEQHAVVNNLFYSISDIERVGDHSENIAEFGEYIVENSIEFSETAIKDLQHMADLVCKAFDCAILARQEVSVKYAKMVSEFEDEVDNLEEELRELHIRRLADGRCSSASGVVFLDVISNMERISDHAYNLAGYVMNEQ